MGKFVEKFTMINDQIQWTIEVSPNGSSGKTVGCFELGIELHSMPNSWKDVLISSSLYHPKTGTRKMGVKNMTLRKYTGYILYI